MDEIYKSDVRRLRLFNLAIDLSIIMFIVSLILVLALDMSTLREALITHNLSYLPFIKYRQTILIIFGLMCLISLSGYNKYYYKIGEKRIELIRQRNKRRLLNFLKKYHWLF